MSAENPIIVNCRSYSIRYFPMYAMFLADCLKKNHDVDPTIATVQNWEDPAFLLDLIEDTNQPIVMWEQFSTKAPTYLDNYFDVADYLNNHTENPLAKGGFWASTHAREFEEFEVFDYIFEGYSFEKAAESIVDLPNQSERYIDIEGDANWATYDLNFDYLDDKTKYLDPTSFSNDTFALQGYLSSFSCPLNCSFCQVTAFRNAGSEFSTRSVEQVIEDFRLIKNEYAKDDINVDSIVIKDLNFFADQERAFEILEKLNDLGLETSFNVDATIFDLTEDFMKKIDELDVVDDIYFGLEAFGEESRKKVRKTYDDSRLEKAFELADEYDLNLEGNVILGLPWQDEEEVHDAINKAIHYINEYRRANIFMNGYKPEIGTDLQQEYYQDVEEELSMEDVVEIYLNNISDYQEILYGEEFDFIDVKKVHNCLRIISRINQAYHECENSFRQKILLKIQKMYEQQVQEKPYFDNSFLAWTLERDRVTFILRNIIPLIKNEYDLNFFKRGVAKLKRDFKESLEQRRLSPG